MLFTTTIHWILSIARFSPEMSIFLELSEQTCICRIHSVKAVALKILIDLRLSKCYKYLSWFFVDGLKGSTVSVSVTTKMRLIEIIYHSYVNDLRNLSFCRAFRQILSFWKVLSCRLSILTAHQCLLKLDE